MELEERYKRCVKATKGVMNQETAELLCSKAVYASRGIQHKKTTLKRSRITHKRTNSRGGSRRRLK